MAMQFKLFTDATLSTTTVSWEKGIKATEGFTPSLKQLLTWVEDHKSLQEDNQVAYGVFDDKNEFASAICEVTVQKHSPRSKWIKMLNLRLHPNIEVGVFNNDVQHVQSAINAYICCILGVFKMKSSHAADTLKVYGRTHEQLTMLTGLATNLNQKGSKHPFKASIEGRWLVVK
jgi:hypothetical protein